MKPQLGFFGFSFHTIRSFKFYPNECPGTFSLCIIPGIGRSVVMMMMFIHSKIGPLKKIESSCDLVSGLGLRGALNSLIIWSTAYLLPWSKPCSLKTCSTTNLGSAKMSSSLNVYSFHIGLDSCCWVWPSLAISLWSETWKKVYYKFSPKIEFFLVLNSFFGWDFLPCFFSIFEVTNFFFK